MDYHRGAGVEALRKEPLTVYGDGKQTKISPANFITETTEAKRPANNYMYAKAATPPKKSKLELRPSCPPLKVRKEKLGDRISALQQMVAPFGKYLVSLDLLLLFAFEVPTCSQEWSLSSAPETLASLSTFSFGLPIRTF
ncbi:hypothetical protein L6452_28476 [Arctium lappa]|uniref:Uncharacterized protein n=1 Tax=Arctium lappa TaxID=4217 RepID=A0ACB8ZYJ6_ARCLA|nr:hypothetical protein L6452_28476 [Arctium lappa]